MHRVQKNNKRVPQKVLIYVEGRNTEPSYFELLKNTTVDIIPIKVVPGTGIGSCVQFINKIYGEYNSLSKKDKSKYKQIWAVFDCDGHPDFELAIKKAVELGFKVAFSNMCIEYWFMLHFYDHNGDSIPIKNNSHSQAQIEEINRYIKKYNKGKSPQDQIGEYNIDSKKVEEDFFELMLAIDPVTNNRRIVDAYQRAKRIHASKKNNGAEYRESVTTMYDLLAQIGVIKDDDNGIIMNIC